MSHIILKCPGCLSQLKIRSSIQRDCIECPRCGERIDVPDRSQIPPTPVTSTTAMAAATPGNSARPSRLARPAAVAPTEELTDDFVDDFIDEDEIRARRESIIFLGIIATAVLAALIAFPSAIYYLLKEDEPPVVADVNVTDATEVAAEVDSTENQNAPVAAAAGPANDVMPSDDDVDMKPATGQPAASELDRTPSIATAESDPEPSEASSTQQPPAESAADAARPAVGAADVPPTPLDNPPAVRPPAVAAPNGAPQPADPTKVAAAAADGRRLRYRWQKGDTHVYQLTISAEFGDGKQNISGSCVYNVNSNGREADDRREGSGSGFVVSADGVIATCAHVVDGAQSIEVLIGEQTYPATVLVSKRKLDLALIKIDAQDLPVTELGDSDDVQLAENVRAFGFPLSTMLGTGIKVATGAVAGIVMHPERGRQIQTDAPINPGNSGGPIVNDSGDVIGIASSKISSSAASSVGFAVPVNKLIRLMQQQNLNVPRAADNQVRSGPEIAAQITPAVAFIKVSGVSAGQVYDVSFNASFTESSRRAVRGMRFPGFPTLPSSNHDRGKMKVTEFGEVVEFGGEASLPFVLGPIGQFFVQPLDPDGDASWEEESTTSLHLVKRAARDPISQMRSRMGGRGRFGPRGPFGGKDPQDETLRVIPAVERTSYRLGPELNERITIHRTYEFVTTENEQKPFLKVQGTGDVVFDLERGMPGSMHYKATLVQKTDDGKVQRIPVTVSYTLRDPEEIKRERAAALKRQQEREAQQQKERSEPNPELVQNLLKDVSSAEGSLRGLSPLKRLASVAVVEDLRDKVLQVLQNHRSNSNSAIQGAAAEAFCHWCRPDQTSELADILANRNAAFYNARKAALRRLVNIGGSENFEVVIQKMSNLSLRSEIKKRLIAKGPDVEDAVLAAVAGLEDRAIRRDLVEVLQKVGTKKSVPLLESLVADGDSLLKYGAQRALDAVKGRL